MYLIFSPLFLFLFFFSSSSSLCVHVYTCVFLLSLSPPRAPVPVEPHSGMRRWWVDVWCAHTGEWGDGGWMGGVNKRRIKGVEGSGRAVYTSVECGVCVAVWVCGVQWSSKPMRGVLCCECVGDMRCGMCPRREWQTHGNATQRTKETMGWRLWVNHRNTSMSQKGAISVH